MARLVRVLLCCLLVFALQQSAKCDTTLDRCVPPCARGYLTTYKQNYAQQTGTRMSDGDFDSSPFPCGNQCWDCDVAQAVAANQQGRRRRQAYNFTAFPDRQWPLPVQYMFNSTFPTPVQLGGIDAKLVIRGAMNHIEAQTCIRFSEISQPSTTPFMSFGSGSGCVAFVGRTLDTISSPIFATNDCLKQFGEMLYLIVQSLGVWHESQRYDRDDYVQVVAENLLPGYTADLAKLDESLHLLVTYGMPYDFASLMHFPGKVFSENGSDTIRTLDPLFQNTIGQRVQLSFLDTKLLNAMYCTASCSASPLSSPCLNGGYQDPNNCLRCHCPDGFSGTYCADLAPAQGATCGGLLTVDTTPQTITSPGYTTPGYYNDTQMKCTWRLQAPIGRQIRLQFTGDFNVYCKNAACYHWVEVRYTGQLNATGPRFCCNSLPSSLLTSSNEALIIFQSNISGIAQSSRRGFQLTYSIEVTATNSSVGVCSPNPCHNNGICNETSTNPAGFTCTCPAGLSGPLCQQGNCGGCSAQPGMLQPQCVTNEVPLRMCNITRPCVGGGSSSSSHHGGGGGWFGGFGGRGNGGRRHGQRTEVVQVPCSLKFCCDNATPVGMFGANTVCVVEGWSNWSACSASCGGGWRVMSQYAVRSISMAGQTFSMSVVVNTTTSYCNTQPCVCGSANQRWGGGGMGGGGMGGGMGGGGMGGWFGGWGGPGGWGCKPCTNVFQQVNGTCVHN